MMHMHYAPTEKRLRIKDPMCGYVPPGDEICRDPNLCTCPECLDWIKPDHDSQANPSSEPK
jgi:hypothetical protein